MYKRQDDSRFSTLRVEHEEALQGVCPSLPLPLPLLPLPLSVSVSLFCMSVSLSLFF